MTDTQTDYMQDSEGRLVPRSMVKPQDLLEDELVRKLHDMGERLSASLAAFRGHAFEEIDGFLDMLSQEYGAKRGGGRGNVVLTSFDGTQRVQIAIGDYRTLGPSLTTAKELIDECLTRWAAGANENLRVIVNDAFQVDQQGRLNVERILSLRRLNIDDETWKRAMQALTDAQRTTHSKRYIRLYQRGNPADDYKQVPLDVASAA